MVSLVMTTDKMLTNSSRYLYNDALWMSERLRSCAESWAGREDLAPRARGKVKLENEIVVMEKFGKRGYGSEMSTQRIVLTDLLGGLLIFELTCFDLIAEQAPKISSSRKDQISKTTKLQSTVSFLT